ncbi:hypothetical protein SCHPADRAFT_400263 [Schizopora paradoxa]|uniref:Uncharacterized protein n=1 Tax=Schizopora paradoxa TaxID=27342 RepID=A0A0H2S7D3_9AGAM|nr:hypothetical protein SCHPADRAFT_400263 [Schizopora paradoxa]
MYGTLFACIQLSPKFSIRSAECESPCLARGTPHSRSRFLLTVKLIRLCSFLVFSLYVTLNRQVPSSKLGGRLAHFTLNDHFVPCFANYEIRNTSKPWPSGITRCPTDPSNHLHPPSIS